ncbi:hypothetical protein G7Z17_g4617 [Cylindrodendrum hubeiense]|uniref:Uncharacterized protein n=1 Tax=Cylindrodendrum hubeiense TaxID=595255 RepID=A0A9P5LGZ8_9HYPO|nr:hypothetical protein G7Z17_g4617 [Cylindrodendrum hubeiense]
MEQPYAIVPSRVSLPPEVILLVIESLAPERTNITLPSSHETTKTLLALTRVCQVAAEAASKLLWQFCTHINSLKRLTDFRKALYCLPPGDPRRPTSLFLALYESDPGPPDTAPPSHSNLPVPYPDFDDIRCATAIQGLLLHTAPTLRRLVIHMPRLAQDRDRTFELLLVGYKALVNLEEFVSIGSRFSITGFPRSGAEGDVWATCWPKLRRLTIDISINKNIFKSLARLSDLEMVTFSFLESPTPTASRFRKLLDTEFNAQSMIAGVKERRLRAVGLVGAGCESRSNRSDDTDPGTHVSSIDVVVYDFERRYQNGDVNILRWLERKASNGTLWDVSSFGFEDQCG